MVTLTPSEKLRRHPFVSFSRRSAHERAQVVFLRLHCPVCQVGLDCLSGGYPFTRFLENHLHPFTRRQLMMWDTEERELYGGSVIHGGEHDESVPLWSEEGYLDDNMVVVQTPGRVRVKRAYRNERLKAWGKPDTEYVMKFHR